ncbi:MAG: sugar phosphate isomerase/epimerase [Spirochaetaceae bacterium]|jgi:sugar phosphate isomerase/epimerase|nr:sugar phosphate isomerase/epimerase [Spirochaetaceae bacterium]
MLQIGLRAHDYGKKSAEELADTLSTFAPVSIQLALAKAFPDPPSVPGGLTPGYARRIKTIFEQRGIAIAVLGCYINPVHPDPDQRDRMLRRFEEHLRFARDFGCPMVGTETGSCNPDCSWHPDTEKPETFELLCASIERLLNTAEKCGSIVAVEAVAGQHTISSVELMAKLLNRFRSPALKVIYDPVNLIPAEGLSEPQDTFFERAFEAFGEHIAAIHAKDFRMEGGKKTGALPAGTGELDYPALLKLLMQKKPGIDILLENSSPATAREIFTLFRKIDSQLLS